MQAILVLLTLSLTFVAGLSPAHALPIHSLGQSRALPPHFTADFDFEGIVRLSNCSGSLVRLVNAADTDQALILTNGHCLENGFPRPGQHQVDRASSRRFGLMNREGEIVGRLNATRLVFATMTGTDMAIYRLQETYAEIQARFGVRPFVLANSRPRERQQIEVVSGYWSRGFRCSIEAFVFRLQESDYLMTDSIRYSRPGCEVYGGTSGSPIIDRTNRTVIGVNNTGNESGRRCTMNNPCEIDETGRVDAIKGYTYGQQTYRYYSCLNAAREFDLNIPGCLLR